MKWPICSRNRLNNGFYGTVDTNYLVGWKELHVFCVFIISYLLLIHIQWQSGQCSSYVLCCRHLSVIMWIPVNPTALFCFQANFHKSLQDPVQYNAPWGFKKKRTSTFCHLSLCTACIWFITTGVTFLVDTPALFLIGYIGSGHACNVVLQRFPPCATIRLINYLGPVYKPGIEILYHLPMFSVEFEAVKTDRFVCSLPPIYFPKIKKKKKSDR